MANGKFLYNNLFPDYSTLSVTSEDPEFPKENLDLPDPNAPCKANANGTQNITLDMGSGYSKAVKGAYLGNVNLSTGNTFNFQASTDNFSSTAQTQAMTLDSRNINYWTKKAVFCSGLSWSAYQYLRFNLAISGDKVRCATPYIARDELELDPNYKWGYSPNTESLFITTGAGKGMKSKKKDYDRFIMTMQNEMVPDSQKEEIDLKLRHCPYVLFLPDGTDGNIYYGILSVNIQAHVRGNNWTVEMTFEEIPFTGEEI